MERRRVSVTFRRRHVVVGASFSYKEDEFLAQRVGRKSSKSKSGSKSTVSRASSFSYNQVSRKWQSEQQNSKKGETRTSSVHIVFPSLGVAWTKEEEEEEEKEKDDDEEEKETE